MAPVTNGKEEVVIWGYNKSMDGRAPMNPSEKAFLFIQQSVIIIVIFSSLQ